MKSILTDEHYRMILSFSRHFSNELEYKDLSQHVILELLDQPKDKIQAIIDKGEFGKWIGSVIRGQFYLGGSTYNRETKGCYGSNNWIKTVSIDETNLCNTLSYSYIIEDSDKDINLDNATKYAKLTDKERMYLTAYIESGCKYEQCSINLDICPQTISIHVKKALEKCKNSQTY